MKFIDNVTPYEFECTEATEAVGKLIYEDHYSQYLTDVIIGRDESAKRAEEDKKNEYQTVPNI